MAARVGAGVDVGVLSLSTASSRVRLLERLRAVEVPLPGWLGLLVVDTECALVTVDADVESSAMDELDQLAESDGQGRAGTSPV